MRFIVVSHTTPPDGDWPLDDLPGAGGRADVLCRCVTAALWTSHGLRPGVEVFLVFHAAHPAAVRIRSDDVHRLNPDERSTAARIRSALGKNHPDPWWEEVERGISVAPFRLRDVLDEVGDVVVLDRDGAPLADDGDATYLLSDHMPFQPDDGVPEEAARTSVGPDWLLGSHAIVLAHARSVKNRHTQPV